jgi:hypothetical protein
MLALTDDELNLIRQAAEPLDLRIRGQYLRSIANELSRYPAITPAVVMRVAKLVQHRFMNGGKGDGRTDGAIARAERAFERTLPRRSDDE